MESSSPFWNQTFVYPNITLGQLRSQYLEISAWSHNYHAASEFLGEIKLDLSGELVSIVSRYHQLASSHALVPFRLFFFGEVLLATVWWPIIILIGSHFTKCEKFPHRATIYEPYVVVNKMINGTLLLFHSSTVSYFSRKKVQLTH